MEDRESIRSSCSPFRPAGGHWIQLLRLRTAFTGEQVVFASTRCADRFDVPDDRFRLVPDANRWAKWKALWCALSVALLFVVERPDVIVSTGALPGYFAVRIGGLLRAKTIWVDSIANAEELSMSGDRARRHCDVVITQREHLSMQDGVRYLGTVIGE